MTLYFVKTHNDEKLAHLYEHIYVNFLRRALKNQGLFAYVDFAVDGETFDFYTQVEVKAYTHKAEAAIKKALAVQPSIDNHAIREAAYEIAAEHGREIEGDMLSIEHSLHALAQKSWSRINDITLKKHGSNIVSVVQESGKKIPTTQLTCRIVADTTHDDKDVALFYVISQAILSNVLLILTGHYQYYFANSKFSFNGGQACAEDTYLIWQEYRPKLTDELDACTKEINSMFANGFIDALANFLRNTDYSSIDGPRYQELAEATGILVGGKGWRALSDEHAIKRILKQSSLEFVHGTQIESKKTLHA